MKGNKLLSMLKNGHLKEIPNTIILIQWDMPSIQKGDIAQLSFDGNVFAHSLLIIEKDINKILIATHTQDEYGRNIATYNFNKIRFIHINGVRY